MSGFRTNMVATQGRGSIINLTAFSNRPTTRCDNKLELGHFSPPSTFWCPPSKNSPHARIASVNSHHDVPQLAAGCNTVFVFVYLYLSVNSGCYSAGRWVHYNMLIFAPKVPSSELTALLTDKDHHHHLHPPPPHHHPHHHLHRRFHLQH